MDVISFEKYILHMMRLKSILFLASYILGNDLFLG